MRKFDYTILDVFAERALEGNALAVFHDARGLSAEQMQSLARETNLSETTFVLPTDDPDHERLNGVRVRIFTTQEELPFAGHPTLGTASWLYLHHPALRGSHEIKLALNVGPISVHFDKHSTQSVRGTMTQNDPVFGAQYDAAEISRVTNIPEADFLPNHAPQTVSTGNPFCIVALRSVEALTKLAIPQRESSAWLAANNTRWFYCIAPAADGTWRARMQFNGTEDPATGSAAGPCIAWLVKENLVAPDTPTDIHQGVEILRPSRLTVQASRDVNRLHNVRVGGSTIPVASGSYFLPDAL